jgi:hypothetical protein
MRLRAALLKAHVGEPSRALSQAWNVFIIYAIVSLIGWALVELPIVLFVPARLISRLAWPQSLLIGAILGELPVSSLRFATLAQRHASLWAMFLSIERRVADEETIPDCGGSCSATGAAVG